MTGLHPIDTKLDKAQVGAHRDTRADALVDRAPRGVMGVRPLCGLTLVVRAARERVVHADSLDDEDPVFYLDVTFGRRHQLAAARLDSARLQRATQGAGESTGGGRYHVVESGGVRLKPGRCLIVRRHLVVHPEEDWLGLGRQERFSKRALHPLDSHP